MNFETKLNCIDLRNITFNGSILDVGGGGEGIISQHSGNSVIVIDKYKSELEESPDIGVKIVMDACDLKFLDNSFDNITCFYSLMYMELYEIEKFSIEAGRVLKNGAFLWIWDVNMTLPVTDVFIVSLKIKVSDNIVITTGYGVSWKREQSADDICEIFKKRGFEIVSTMHNFDSFSLCLRKL
ncbi:MAG: class I SAM-dependent methyltransferase [Oscillospiraceae bacterium]|nr:class I SAM-dependent methyltransferase [Oscillospiraceae bacterium]